MPYPLNSGHLSLARALQGLGKPDEAIAAYRDAIRVQADDAVAHREFGSLLRTSSRYAEALAELRRAHELGSKRPGWDVPAGRRVEEAARCVALADRLPAVSKGVDLPRDVPESLTFSRLAYDRGYYAAAARLLAGVLASDLGLADDREAGHRYHAACAAALAVAGNGKDDPAPDDAARAALRGQALGWLRAEREAWARALDSEPKNRSRVVHFTPVSFWSSDGSGLQSRVSSTMQQWKKDPDLASVRDPEALAKLPEDERKPWQA